MILTEEIKQILIDRFDSWELCELLKIDTEELLSAFEDKFEENLEDILELAGFESTTDEDEGWGGTR